MSTFLPKDSNDNAIPVLRLKDGRAHAVAVSGVSARSAAAFEGTTRVVSLYADVDVYVRFGDASVTAGASDHFFPAGIYYDFAIGGSDTAQRTHLAAVAVSDNGSIYISEKE